MSNIISRFARPLGFANRLRAYLHRLATSLGASMDCLVSGIQRFFGLDTFEMEAQLTDVLQEVQSVLCDIELQLKCRLEAIVTDESLNQCAYCCSVYNNADPDDLPKQFPCGHLICAACLEAKEDVKEVDEGCVVCPDCQKTFFAEQLVTAVDRLTEKALDRRLEVLRRGSRILGIRQSLQAIIGQVDGAMMAETVQGKDAAQ